MWPHRLSVAALLVDGRTAYENALSTPETALALAERGYTEPLIAADLDEIEALEKATQLPERLPGGDPVNA